MTIKNSNLKFRNSLTKRKKTIDIILHHAASAKCSVSDVHSWHLKNGWAGIGYHFFIMKDGSVYQGRPLDRVGAHAKGANSYSIGICFEGDYTKEVMPAAQFNAGREVIAYLKKKYPSIKRIVKHKDVCATSCPGKNFPFEEMIAVKKKCPYTEPINTRYKGCKGTGVKWVQWHLLEAGYSVGSSAIDGSFGPATDKAVRKFQTDKQLEIDGRVGPKTRTALKEAVK